MIHLIDRSRVEVDAKCPARRYWNTEYEIAGKPLGIVPVEEAYELKFGSAIHSAQASLALQALPSEQISQALDAQIIEGWAESPQQVEMRCLAQGLYWGFQRVVWPVIQRDYDILLIEKELTYPVAPGIEIMVKPDLILRRKSDRTIWYREYKSTGFKTQNWMEMWKYAIQLHIGCLAAERELGEPVEGAEVIGFYKGYPKDGKLRSPFTYAYYLQGVPGVVPDRWMSDWARGWDLRSLAEYPGGLQAWVQDLPIETLQEQFPLSGPITLRRDMCETVLEQIEYREKQVLNYRNGQLPKQIVFPQKGILNGTCRPLIGKPCPYLECCFSPSVAADPIGTGLYQPRQPHHTIELMEMEEAA